MAHSSQVLEVDDQQLAALRRLWVAFGPIEVVEVVAMTQKMIRVGA